ncbi:hypothetical protein HNQ07_001171 [Deinococcus metalli]|uniref:Uncharacterized protein n=1 Tax=Deinococcus metalli TaxID=1141878 RepID=A0A7W8KCM0_9DEIO|nr:PPC domain-containing protein [Deinococcus metalli]MBB5375714.1 hypothetical protein [Deinococcus metalli]GHF37592.1 hypothetical protein GCM10017781_12880 [Deinococcus metalli]
MQQWWRHILILFVLAGQWAAAVSAQVPKTVAAGQAFTVRVDGLPGNAQDWVTVVPAGSSDSGWGEYYYSGGKRSADFTFRGLAAGAYELRVYFDYPAGGMTVRSRFPFRVGAAAASRPAPAAAAPARPAAGTRGPARLQAGKYTCSMFTGSGLMILGDLAITADGRYQGVQLDGGGERGKYTYDPASRVILFSGPLGGSFGKILYTMYKTDTRGENFIEIGFMTQYTHTMSCSID